MTATATSRRRLSPAERRQRLLEIGLELFGESSYDALSTDEIAARAGISRGLLFHYFGSKRGYYVAVIREAADRLLERSLAAHQETAAAAEGQLEAFLGFVEDNAGLFTLLMQSGVGVDGEVRQIVDRTRLELAQRVAPRLAVAPSPSTELRDSAAADLDQLALTAWIGAVEAAAVEWADLRRRGVTAIDRSQLTRLLTRMLPPVMREAPLPAPSQMKESP